MWDKNKIVITAIKDPFDPYGSRFIRQVDWEGKRTALDYMKEIYPLMPDDVEIASSVNGKALGKAIDTYELMPGDNLVFCLSPEGDNALRMIAIIAVVLVAIYAPYAMGMVTEAGALTLGGSMMSAGIMVGGMMLVNAVLPPAMPDALTMGDPSAESSTYGWTAGANPIDPGRPWAILYGTMRVFPQILSRYISTVDNKQSLNILFGLADHVLNSVTLPEFNENEEEQYADVVTTYLLGDDDQGVMPGFGDTYTEQAVGQKLLYSTPRTVTVDGNATAGIVIGIIFPQGLYHMTSDGTVGAAEVTILLEYRSLESPPSGDWTTILVPSVAPDAYVASILYNTGDLVTYTKSSTAWADETAYIKNQNVTHNGVVYKCLVAHTSTDASALNIYGYRTDYGTEPGVDMANYTRWHHVWVVVGSTAIYMARQTKPANYPESQSEPEVGLQAWAFWTEVSFTGNIVAQTRKAIRRTYRVDHLTADEYEVRVSLTVDPPEGVRYSNDVYFDHVQSVIYDDFSYPGASLAGVNLLATDQLSGGMPRTSFLISRTSVSVWTGSAWEDKPSNNPAWATYDMHVNVEYGAGIPYARMNYSEFATWAAFCVTNSYEVNIYFDSFQSFPQAVNHISTIGRASVVQRGTQFGVVIDQASSPVQMFGMGNIVANSYTETFLPKADRANSVEVTYFDSSLNYERRTIYVRSSGFDTDEDITEKKIQITLYGCTTKQLALDHAKFLLNCNEYLIRTVSFEVGIDALASEVGDVINVSHDVPQWGYSGHVTAATSTTVTMDRFVILESGESYQVIVRHYDDDALETATISFVAPAWVTATSYAKDESVTENSGNKYTSKLAHTSTTDNRAGIGPSWSTYWTLDNTEISIRKLKLSSSWSQTPQAEDVISFGKVDIAVKEFRIASITRSQELTRTIKALEYRAEVYDDTVSIPEYPAESDLLSLSGLAAREIWDAEGGPASGLIHLSWRGFAIRFYVFYRENGDSIWISLGLSYENFFDVRNLIPGKTYDFAVSLANNPYNAQHVTATFDGFEDTVLPIWGTPIWNISGLEIVGQGNNTIWQHRDLRLRWNPIVNMSMDAGDAAGRFPPASELAFYRIKIYSSDDNVLRRERLLTSPSYVYTYEKNSEDGLASVLIIRVWAVHSSGRESLIPATLSVSNPAPAAPSGLSSYPYMRGVQFEWIRNTEIDFSHYAYRIKVASNVWSVWIETFSTFIVRSLTGAEKTAHGGDANIKFEVKAFDTFGTPSIISMAQNSALSLEIEATDIEKFAVEASKIHTKIPIITGDSWTNDTPDTNSITWNEHSLFYNGVEYIIAASNTDKKYIWWNNGDSLYTKSDTHPAASMEPDDFIIAVNIDGVHDLAWNAIANQVIGSAWIQELAVTNAHINDLAAEKINAGTLDAARIGALSIVVGKLNANATNLMFTSSTRDFFDLAGATKPADNAEVNTIDAGDGLNVLDTVANTKLGTIATNADVTGSNTAYNTARVSTLGATTLIVSGYIGTGLVRTLSLEALAVTADKIAANTITAGEIAARTITAGLIATGTITANEMHADSINTSELIAGSVTAAIVSTNEIIASAANIKNAVITGAKIGNLQVDTLQIKGRAVTIPIRGWIAGTISPGTADIIISAAITSVGTEISVSASFGVYGSGHLLIYFYRDAVLLATFGITATAGAIPNATFGATISDTPGSGSFTYSAKGTIQSGGCTCINRSIVLLETKK